MTYTDPRYAEDRLFEELRMIVVDRQRQAWRDDAACRGIGPDRFFSDRGDVEAVAAAKALCEVCPVTAECFDYAARHRVRVGVWGGYGASKVRSLSVGYAFSARDCDECGRSFEPDQSSQRVYCSDDCYAAHNRRHRWYREATSEEVAS